MITQVDVDSDNSFTVPIVGATPKNSLLIRSITGLNPPDLTPFIGDYARDGGIYQGRRVGVRNVVMLMELNPNPALGETVSNLRERLYKAFLDPLVEADYLKMVLHLDDGRLLELVGYTEKLETEIFSVDTFLQASLICPDPYLRDTTPTVITSVPGLTQLPFAYTGTAETGFEVEITITTATNTLTLANNTVTDDPASPDYYRGRMVLTRSFVPGDVVKINTVRGYRKTMVTLASNGSTTTILPSLTPLSRWLELHSQSNTMRVYGATPSDLSAVIKKLTYVQSYWGV